MKRSCQSLLASMLVATLVVSCGRAPDSTGARQAAARVVDAIAPLPPPPAPQALPQPRHYRDTIGNDVLELQGLSSQIDLSAAELETSSSQPGLEVVVRNVPTNKGKVRVAILDPQGTTHTWAMLRDLGDANRFALMTPVLPAEILDQGNARLVVYARRATSQVLTLRIDPLPPAPPDKGAAAVVQKFLEITESHNPVAGEASSSLLPILRLLVDDPGNPSSFLQVIQRKQAENPAFAAAVDSVLSTTGVATSLEQYRAAVANLPAPTTTGGGAYRTQSGALPYAQRTLEDTLLLMQARRNLAIFLRTAQYHIQSNLSAAIAALAASKSVAQDINVMLNTMALGNYLLTMYRVSSMPSKLQLARPTLQGACDGNGLTYYGSSSSCSGGTWSVTGSVVNEPTRISIGDLKARLTAPGASQEKYAFDISVHLGGLLASEATYNWLAERLGWQQSNRYRNLLQFFLDPTNRAIARDVYYDGASNTIQLGRPFTYFQGDMSGYTTATFRSNTGLRSVESSAGRTYRLQRGRGGSFTISAKTLLDEASAESSATFYTRSPRIASIAISPPSLALYRREDSDAAIGRYHTGQLQATAYSVDGIVDESGVQWTVSDGNRLSVTSGGLVSVNLGAQAGSPTVTARSVSDDSMSTAAGVEVVQVVRGVSVTPPILYQSRGSNGPVGKCCQIVPTDTFVPAGTFTLRNEPHFDGNIWDGYTYTLLGDGQPLTSTFISLRDLQAGRNDRFLEWGSPAKRLKLLAGEYREACNGVGIGVAYADVSVTPESLYHYLGIEGLTNCWMEFYGTNPGDFTFDVRTW
ncbi:MAG: hypothetical protein FJZ01_20070 [Candidatus Sericytochromatia bacterium]|nr:hypothetical protein [Candidatus Tanganyikabacteria bacterium]